MNTLSRAITAHFFRTPAEYCVLRRHWSALVNSPRRHELRAEHYLLYLALCGKDWRKAFKPISNKRKLANGGFHQWVMLCSLVRLHSALHEEDLLAPFDGLVTPAMLAEIRYCVPITNPYLFSPEDFAPGAFPFDAYRVPPAWLVKVEQGALERSHA